MVQDAAVVHDMVGQDMELCRTHVPDISVRHVGAFYVGHKPAVELVVPVIHVTMCMGMVFSMVMLHGVMLHGMALFLHNNRLLFVE